MNEGRGAFAPRDGAGLALVRIGFGLVMAFGAVRAVVSGKVEEHYLRPEFHFTYMGFSWVEPPPRPLMYGLFAVLTVSALYIAFGRFTRVAAGVYFLRLSSTFGSASLKVVSTR